MAVVTAASTVCAELAVSEALISRSEVHARARSAVHACRRRGRRQRVRAVRGARKMSVILRDLRRRGRCRCRSEMISCSCLRAGPGARRNPVGSIIAQPACTGCSTASPGSTSVVPAAIVLEIWPVATVPTESDSPENVPPTVRRKGRRRSRVRRHRRRRRRHVAQRHARPYPSARLPVLGPLNTSWLLLFTLAVIPEVVPLARRCIQGCRNRLKPWSRRRSNRSRTTPRQS